ETEIEKDKPIDGDLLVSLGMASSKSDAKRLFEQRAVKLDGVIIIQGEELTDEEGEIRVLTVGKKTLKLKVK
ncbi:MAG: hypothetical protein AAB801_00490, partial [Patescibacteria group bacterium]